jgi:signal peptidase I
MTSRQLVQPTTSDDSVAPPQYSNGSNKTGVPPSDLTLIKKHRAENIRSILATLAIVISALIVALAIAAYVFQSYQVDGPSMESTLMNSDRLIVYKLPRTWARITDHPYIPKRGDIIVFSDSGLGNYLPGPTKQLIKRVIGLPGDHLVISNGAITIYNKQHPKGFDPDKTLPYDENLPITTGSTNIIVPKNDVFVCGDNRVDSLDSRVFGPVPVKNIIGQLVLRVLPLDKIKDF